MPRPDPASRYGRCVAAGARGRGVRGRCARHAGDGAFATRVPDRTATGDVAAMSLYAGESVGAVKRVVPAREIIRELVEEAEQLLRRPR
jgi:NAD(P)H-dependent flavin oxidoreductase YrpB (nitropropane dioxygenase family)